MEVPITGASGCVGSNVAKRLLSVGHDVIAMVMPGDPNRETLAPFPNLQVVEADLADQAAIDVACRDATNILRLATQLMRGDTPVDRFYDVNAFGTLRLLGGGAVRPEQFKAILAKGVHSPLAGNGPHVERVLQLDTPGVTSANLWRFVYQKRHRPMYPFETEASYPKNSRVYSADFQ